MVVPISHTSSRQWINPDEMELDEVSCTWFIVFNRVVQYMGSINTCASVLKSCTWVHREYNICEKVEIKQIYHYQKLFYFIVILLVANSSLHAQIFFLFTNSIISDDNWQKQIIFMDFNPFTEAFLTI